MSMLAILAAIIIMVHCTCMIAKLNHRNWFGHRLQFIGLSLAFSFIGGGAVGFVLGWPPASWLLVMGIAGRVLFDRRERT